MAYSLDMRERAIELLGAGRSKAEVSEMLGVGRTTLLRWEQRAVRGELAAHYPSVRGGRKVDDEKLKEYVKNHPDAYQAEIGDAIGAKENTVCRALQRLGITRKKRPRSTENEMKKNVRSIKKREKSFQKKSGYI